MKFGKEEIKQYYGDNCKITNIDFEEVVVKTLNDEYEIEISGYKNKKQNLYLWKNHHEIVGTIRGLVICDFMEGVKLFELCIKNKKYIDIDFNRDKKEGGAIFIEDLKYCNTTQKVFQRIFK